MSKAATMESMAETWRRVRSTLLEERRGAAFWTGELSASALSTATAVSALASVRQALAHSPQDPFAALIVGGVNWLVRHQNADGGWGDTVDSPSNLATTALAQSALKLGGRVVEPIAAAAVAAERAEAYLQSHGGAAGDDRESAIKRAYGDDSTFAAPILMNCALAGLARWSTIPRLPFELAVLSHRWLRLMRIQVVSYALPALIAIGQLLHLRNPSRNPLLRLIRTRVIERTLRRLAAIQPASGGYIEAVPLTSFVVMSLAAAGRPQHEVAGRGQAFLAHTVRPDGSWPIDSNLAVWLTSGAVNALADEACDDFELAPVLQWLIDNQQRQVHPFTDAPPGGWGWTHLSGGVPDADDTAGALLALSRWPAPPVKVVAAAAAGLRWLIDLQNDDGGWPTFCRGWGKLPFDRSAADLTAHAMRAIAAWRKIAERCDTTGQPATAGGGDMKSLPPRAEMDLAISRGLEYLRRQQAADGSWLPLWFGNQAMPRGVNPVFGTARVLTAFRDLDLKEAPEARQGFKYLLVAQNPDGGWGGGPGVTSSIEESAVALEALSGWLARPEVRRAVLAGGGFLVEMLSRQDRLGNVTIDKLSPIGLYFTTLWYSEKLYPLIWSAGALGQVLRSLRS